VAIGYVQHLLEDLALLEERLVAGVWTNAGFQVKYVINQDRHQYRQTCLKGHIVCAPQSVGPTAADGHPFAFPDLCESFQIVYVGDTSTLSDLQRDLRQRAKMHIPLDRELPFVRREPVRKYLQFVWHHRLRGDCRRSFGTSHTSPAWAAYFDTLLPPGAEIGIPQPLVDAATWLSSKDAAEQELRAAGHKPSESGENVTRVQRTEADDEGEQNDASAGQEPGQQDEDMQRAPKYKKCRSCSRKEAFESMDLEMSPEAEAETVHRRDPCTCGPRPVDDDDDAVPTVPARNGSYAVGAALNIRRSGCGRKEWRCCTITHALERTQVVAVNPFHRVQLAWSSMFRARLPL
jgi:hypothetical protein